jgi:hypothetical protein
MLKNNIKYKKVCRLQVFGGDNVYNTARYQYSTMGTLPTSIINSTLMRFELEGNLGGVILSKNARVVVEGASIPGLVNMSNKSAIIRLATSTEDKVFDSKKGINGNPILFCLGIAASVGALTNLSNGHDSFYSLNIPSSFLSKGFIEMELEVASQTTTAISFTGTALASFYITLILIY